MLWAKRGRQKVKHAQEFLSSLVRFKVSFAQEDLAGELLKLFFLHTHTVLDHCHILETETRGELRAEVALTSNCT